MAELKLVNVNKVYPNGVHAVIDFNLEIEDKDFVVLVGPSGCGKSTTLRMIAGLEEISAGDIFINDTRVNDLDPKDRNISMVFQSYALYPHMTVFDNMAYGLKIKRSPIYEIEKKVVRAAKSLGLLELLDRIPAELSGGQRQRVALGRAMVKEAQVFLMDEPLSNLDAKLRVQTRSELIALHESLGTTTIYVTHDQIEAMTMATKIVVMSDGVVEQVASPEITYNYPNNMFVAGFIGTPPMNFFEVIVNKDGSVLINDKKIKISDKKMSVIKENDLFDETVIFGIRPEDIKVVLNESEYSDDCCLSVSVDFAEVLGADTNVYLKLQNEEVISKVDETINFAVGQEIKVYLDTKKIHFFNKETGQRYLSDSEESAKAELQKLGRK